MKISVKKIFLLLFIFFFLNGFFRSPYVPKLDRDNMSYKRDIELVLEYEGKEYKLNSTIQCIDKKVYWGWGGGVPTGELVIHWKSTITNNKLTLLGGEELEMENFFEHKEEQFYSDESIEGFKAFLERFYDEKTGYYYNKRAKYDANFLKIADNYHYTIHNYDDPNIKYYLGARFSLGIRFIYADNPSKKSKLERYNKLKLKSYKISKRY